MHLLTQVWNRYFPASAVLSYSVNSGKCATFAQILSMLTYLKMSSLPIFCIIYNKQDICLINYTYLPLLHLVDRLFFRNNNGMFWFGVYMPTVEKGKIKMKLRIKYRPEIFTNQTLITKGDLRYFHFELKPTNIYWLAILSKVLHIAKHKLQIETII